MERNILTGDPIDRQPSYPAYSQADPRWANRRIVRDRIGASGCLLTALASKISGDSGRTVTPADLDDWLDEHEGYQNDLIKWGAVIDFAATLGLKYQPMERQGYSGVVIGAGAVNAHTHGQILEVRTRRGSTHFVLLLNAADGSIMDPGSGPGTEFTTIEQEGYRPVAIRWLRGA